MFVKKIVMCLKQSWGGGGGGLLIIVFAHLLWKCPRPLFITGNKFILRLHSGCSLGICESSSSSSAFPSCIPGVHHFGRDWWPLFNPTIEVVTFCPRGWCMLGVCLLLAFTHLGHECQDLLSLCNGMHVCTH